MRITGDQCEILDSFIVKRINDNDEFLRIVDRFRNVRNENLVDYLKGDAFEDDRTGNVACYIVFDLNNEILCYFSIRCGTLYSEFKELELFQKHKRLKLELQEISEKIGDNSELKEIVSLKEKEVAEYRKRIEDLLGRKDFPTPHKRVEKSYPAIELSHFCVNQSYIEKWESLGFGAKNRMGATLFWHVIVKKIEEIRGIVGCEYLYLFAADSTPDRHLVGHYMNRMDFHNDSSMLTLQPIYDSKCEFLCNRIEDLITNRDYFYDHFNDIDEI